MGRAYSIRPYSIGDFPAVYDHNLGASSHPWLASCSLSEAEGESSHILVQTMEWKYGLSPKGIIIILVCMRRAYSILPYSIGDFPATFDPNLGPSSHPWLASGVEP